MSIKNQQEKSSNTALLAIVEKVMFYLHSLINVQMDPDSVWFTSVPAGKTKLPTVRCAQIKRKTNYSFHARRGVQRGVTWARP